MALEKKKIAWIAHEANLSGANIALLEYVDALKDAYDFHIILPHHGNMEAALIERNIPVSIILQYGWAISLNPWNLKQWLKVGVRTIIAVLETKKLIKRNKVGMIFTNTLCPFVGGIAAKRLKKPHVWWIHEFGEEDFGFKIGWGHVHIALRKIEKWSNLIICNSLAVTKKFKTLMPKAEIRCIYQPVTWKLPFVIGQKKLARYVMFGQIVKSKGHLEVLRALVKVKEEGVLNFSLHITGPCENKAYLKELQIFIEKYDLNEHVIINTGFFQKEEILPFYEALILASPSEAFGRVVVEASKAGLKVIVKNSGGGKELINETNGLLYRNIHDLIDIFTGQKPMPAGKIKLNYNQQEEIFKLKNFLAALLLN